VKKKNLIFTALYLVPAAVAMAANDILPAGMTSLMDSILKVFTGPFVKAILIISLSGCAIAYAFNKDNEKMKRNAIAIGVACAILVTASFIIEKIWDAASSG
jgi:type IV secretory pathway VirB2 component (pilin)